MTTPEIMLGRGARPRKTPAKVLYSRVFAPMFRGLKEPSLATNLTHRILRAMSWHPFVRMIIERRKSQILPYCKTPRFRGDPGFDVIKRRRQEPMDESEEARRQEIITLVQTGAFAWERPVDGRRGGWSGDGRMLAMAMAKWLTRLLEDNLTFDGGALRLEPGLNSKLYPVSWLRPVDGSLVRLADPELYTRQYREDLKYVEYVIVNPSGEVEYELGWDELAYFVRDPRLDPGSEGYGTSRLEYCVDTLTGASTAFRYNISQFTENKMPRGVLQVPATDEDVLDEFLTTLEANIGGAMGQWNAIPVIGSDGDKPAVQWIELGQRPSDMQWRDFIVFCINLLCSLFQISAEEVGFQSFMSRQTAFAEQSPEARITQGQDSGFLPLMQAIADFINTHIVSRFDDGKWEFVWVELGSASEERDVKLRGARMSSGYTSIEEERIWGDKPVRHIPVNLGLWQKTESAILKAHPEVVFDPDKLYGQTMLLYANAGGNISLATRVPMGPQTVSLLSQELQLAQATAGGVVVGEGRQGVGGQSQAPVTDADDDQQDEQEQDAQQEFQDSMRQQEDEGLRKALDALRVFEVRELEAAGV